jgi:hypothetical protein
MRVSSPSTTNPLVSFLLSFPPYFLSFAPFFPGYSSYYNPIVMQKVVWLLDIAKSNPQKTKYFVWLDSGGICSPTIQYYGKEFVVQKVRIREERRETTLLAPSISLFVLSLSHLILSSSSRLIHLSFPLLL